MQKLIEGGSPERTKDPLRRGGGARLRLLAAASIAVVASGAYGGIASAHASTIRPPSCEYPTKVSMPCNSDMKQPNPYPTMMDTKKPSPCECDENEKNKNEKNKHENEKNKNEKKKPEPSPSKSESKKPEPSPSKSESKKPEPSPSKSESEKPTVVPTGAPKTGGGGTAGSGAMFLVPLAAAGVLAPIGIVLTRRRRVAND